MADTPNPAEKAPAAEPTLIFLQHGRTAGNATTALLLEEYGEEAVFKLGGTPPHDNTYDDFLAVADRDRRRLYAGHFAYGVHRHVAAPYEYFTTLRDPLDRVVSNYSAWGRDGTHTLATWLDHDHDAFNGMVKRHIGIGVRDGKPYDYLNDRPLDRAPEIGADDLARAIEFIERDFSLVLLHGHFVENMVLLQRHYATTPLFSTARQNINHVAEPLLPQHLPATAIEQIEDRNRYDRMLFDHFRPRYLAALRDQDDAFRDEVRIMSHIDKIASVRGTHTVDDDVFVARLNAGLNQLLAAGNVRDVVEVLHRIIRKRSIHRDFCRTAIAMVQQIGTTDDVARGVAAYRQRFEDDAFIGQLAG